MKQRLNTFTVRIRNTSDLSNVKIVVINKVQYTDLCRFRIQNWSIFQLTYIKMLLIFYDFPFRS